MHFVIYASSNHGKGLHNVTPIDLLAQSAVLSDGVVVPCLHEVNYMCRGGFAYPPYGTVLHNLNRPAPYNYANHPNVKLLKKYLH